MSTANEPQLVNFEPILHTFDSSVETVYEYQLQSEGKKSVKFHEIDQEPQKQPLSQKIEDLVELKPELDDEEEGVGEE